MKLLTIYRHPPETAPVGVPVLVAGGMAKKMTGGEWFSVLTDRPLEWTPTWWSFAPGENEADQ